VTTNVADKSSSIPHVDRFIVELFQNRKRAVVQNSSVKDIEHFAAITGDFGVMFKFLRRRKLEARTKKRD
jgi:hypothetical protein